MNLEINEKLYYYTFGEEGYLNEQMLRVLYRPITYIFDPDSFIICRKDAPEAESVENPIVFPAVSRIEAQRAYVGALNNKKLQNDFKNLDDDKFWNLFWGYFDDGAQKLRDYEMFEEKYRIKRIVDWCEENYIPYFINKKDEFIKEVLDYNICSVRLPL